MNAINGALSGLKIVACSTAQAGTVPYMLMADLGADVIKIEPLEIGDITRIGGYRVGDISAMYASANRGKRSVALDLSKEEGLAVFKEIAASADVLVQNFRPGAVDRMGIGPDEMLKLNPELIYVSISGFGPDGPYRDWRVYDPIIQSISGVVSIQQSQDVYWSEESNGTSPSSISSKYLSILLRSIKNSKFIDEVVISDDSKSNIEKSKIEKILYKFANDSKGIEFRFVQNKKNLGAFNNKFNVLRLCNSEKRLIDFVTYSD